MQCRLPRVQVLCIRGFLAARKHADRILLLVEMLGTSGFPCFKAGIKTVYALRRRFALQATEPQVLHQIISRRCCFATCTAGERF